MLIFTHFEYQCPQPLEVPFKPPSPWEDALLAPPRLTDATS